MKVKSKIYEIKVVHIFITICTKSIDQEKYDNIKKMIHFYLEESLYVL